jgi:hypothetical protein
MVEHVVVIGVGVSRVIHARHVHLRPDGAGREIVRPD